ncbi:hypothetical protein PVAP13_2NG109600 [Panicum virgatum]|uniref:GATA-type domain-containing protein n=1 Tax=Panicum virgatum TaxID=38727 RepID=A0A8T0VG82_PANVG|nr:hypothetical protein PVAP13_2NG109600 [Panicum virgatum]
MAADPSCQKVVRSLDRNKSKICTQCHTTVTSLWRDGPFGRKSLCNACGLRYRRKGLEAQELEREEDKGQNKRRINRVQHSRKVTEFYKNGDNRKKNSKNKDPREVGVSTMLTTIDCGNEVMLKQIEQHGEEAVRGAIILMDFSGAALS